MNQNRTALVMGIVLIVVGALFLVGQSLDLFQFGDLWPMIIVGVGGAFFLGMILGGKSTGGLAIPGSIITMIGKSPDQAAIFTPARRQSPTWSAANNKPSPILKSTTPSSFSVR